MNKIGVHASTFIGDIKNQSIENCLSKVAKIGYDVMELPLLNPDALAVWRNLWSNSEDLATEALRFIKNGLNS